MTGHMNRSDEEVLALWCAGRNTADIARLLGWPECDVANRLPRILERRRADAKDAIVRGIALCEAVARL